MKFLFLAVLLILPPLPLARADANEEEFTIKVEHYESIRTPNFDEAEFRGRAWDLRSVLAAARFPSGMEWLHSGNERGRGLEGSTYCIRIAPVKTSGRSLAIAPEQREQTLINLREQLLQRGAEMKAAGAQYRIESPSNCGEEPGHRRLARR